MKITSSRTSVWQLSVQPWANFTCLSITVRKDDCLKTLDVILLIFAFKNCFLPQSPCYVPWFTGMHIPIIMLCYCYPHYKCYPPIDITILQKVSLAVVHLVIRINITILEAMSTQNQQLRHHCSYQSTRGSEPPHRLLQSVRSFKV